MKGELQSTAARPLPTPDDWEEIRHRVAQGLDLPPWHAAALLAAYDAVQGASGAEIAISLNSEALAKKLLRKIVRLHTPRKRTRP